MCGGYFSMLIARDATTMTVTIDIVLWIIISSFARLVRGNISVGLNAVDVVKAKKK